MRSCTIVLACGLLIPLAIITNRFEGMSGSIDASFGYLGHFFQPDPHRVFRFLLFIAEVLIAVVVGSVMRA